MPSTNEMEVLLFAINESPSPDLAKIAIRRGWPVLQVPFAEEGLDEVRRRQPIVVIVQVSMRLGEDLDLLYLLRTNSARVSLIAVATAHYHEIERAVRSIGVNCYLPSARDAELIEQAVDEVLHRRQPNPSASRDAKKALAQNKKVLSSSASLNPPP